MEMDDLTDALLDALEARTAEKNARESYSGYSWGYVGEHLINARMRAEKRVSELLTAAVVAVHRQGSAS